jgi:hypothetical protein
MSSNRRRRTIRSLTAALAILAVPLIAAVPAGASSAVTIGTVGAPGFHGGGYEFGGGESVASIGQVVTVPEGVTSLESFSLSSQMPSTYLFRAYVFAWSGEHTEGPALYESGDLHAVSSGEYQPLTLQTGGVPVTSGHRYVLFLSRSAEQAADEADTEGYALQIVRGEGMFAPPPYQEGGLVTLSNGFTPSEWGARSWSDFSSFFDAEFQAMFDIPAPPPPIEPETTVVPTVLTVPSITPVAPAPVHCVVPSLGGLTLAAVKQALNSADCSLGTVAHHWFKLPKGELMEQNSHQGRILPIGAKVDVWLSRGPHRRHLRR